MAGRHRKPPAWRRTLLALLRSRARVREEALRAEIVALRATVVELQDHVARIRAEAEQARADAERARAEAAAAPVRLPAPTLTTLALPLIRLALDDVAVDRGPDEATTEIVLDPAGQVTPQPAADEDRLAWSVLAGLPERPLLDPRLDRDDTPVDHRIEDSGPIVVRRTA